MVHRKKPVLFRYSEQNNDLGEAPAGGELKGASLGAAAKPPKVRRSQVCGGQRH